MNILQLCCFSSLYSFNPNVECIDKSLGGDVFHLPNDYGKSFDFILAAPPCTQFTKANASRWLDWPSDDINVAIKCLVLCVSSGRPWVLENPPGRICSLIPELKQFRRLTLSDINSNKEWVLFSNLSLSRPNNSRYGKSCVSNVGRVKRNSYPTYFFNYIESQLSLFGLLPGQCLDLHPGLKPGLYQELNKALHSGLNSNSNL